MMKYEVFTGLIVQVFDIAGFQIVGSKGFSAPSGSFYSPPENFQHSFFFRNVKLATRISAREPKAVKQTSRDTMGAAKNRHSQSFSFFVPRASGNLWQAESCAHFLIPSRFRLRLQSACEL
jgi:hypothetical protein